MNLYIFIISLTINYGTHRLLRDLNQIVSVTIDTTQDDSSILKQLRYNNAYRYGMDEHYTNHTLNGKKLYNITKSFILADILRNLENLHTSETTKLEYLSKYDDWKDSSKYTHNLSNGGLFDEWNFNIDR
jgi:hypothetical protein